MGAFESLRHFIPILAAFAWMVTVLIAFTVGEEGATTRERAAGNEALARLRQERADQRAELTEANLAKFQQQVERVNQVAQQLQQTQQQLASAHQELQERIPNVTTVYLPEPAGKPASIPRCVFTAGWVRDFNLALGGAPLPAPTAGANTTGYDAATWPAPGTAQELLESGVTPADILAFAQDYGRWALDLRAKLVAFQRKD
ncbi:hypothetical protein [Pseudomonas mosselii]|uniref:Lysis protein n=1 Tax=Pseudomonas mosselii TaxID=78327 RepID=A0ABX9B2T1_9PSED|nr:hypothetical protein [Pseudomonas mosselii]QZP26204.1 lysis protein [Pseudomonas mosselii]